MIRSVSEKTKGGRDEKKLRGKSLKTQKKSFFIKHKSLIFEVEYVT